MTVGKSISKLENGATIDLHGHQTKITHTDAEDTTVQYPNLARRTFSTHALNGFLDLKVFPVGTEIVRPTALGSQHAIIEAVTGDCCYQVRITEDACEPENKTFTYAQFIIWHMGKVAITTPKFISNGVDNLPAAAEFAPKDDEPEDDSNPFEGDLKAEIARLQHELDLAEANGQTRINNLLRERAELMANIATLKSNHAAIIAGYEQDMKHLEAKAAILNPAPVRKEVCTLAQRMRNPEERSASDMQLAANLSEGWTILDMSYDFDETTWRWITLVRDLPADRPKATLPATTAVQPHIGAVPLGRPPMTQPPMPANHTIIHQPVSRALTHNGPKPGETKRIPSLQEFRARQQANKEEIAAILQHTADEHEDLRRQFAQRPSHPFGYAQGG